MEENGNSITMVARLDGSHALRKVGKFRLQPKHQAELLEILDRPHDNPATTAFITTIEHKIAKFLVVKELDAERKSAADSRKTLKRLATALRKLSTELEDMPDKHGDAYFRLNIAVQATFCPVPPTRPEPPPWDPDCEHVGVWLGGESFISLLLRDLQVLDDASKLTLEIGKDDAGGQRAKAAQTFLAREIAQAFKHLGEAPTTTENGRFEQVLRLCLKAGGEYVGDAHTPVALHTLVMKTLTATKSTTRPKSTKPPRKKKQKQT